MAKRGCRAGGFCRIHGSSLFDLQDYLQEWAFYVFFQGEYKNIEDYRQNSKKKVQKLE